MDLFRQDLRYGFRRLISSPLFTVIAALSLAIGIGANTAIFTVVNAVLWQGLPVSEADRLVDIYTSDDGGLVLATSSYPDYEDIRAETALFKDVIAYQLFLGQAEQTQGSAPVLGEIVSGNYFDVLGVRAAIGRTFAPEEYATPGTQPVVVLGHGYWSRVYGGDRSVVGSTIRLNRRPYTIIGVAGPEFDGMYPAIRSDMFVPSTMINVLMPGSSDRLEARGSRGTFLKGRLADGVSAEEAAAGLSVIASRLQAEYPMTNRNREMTAIATSSISIHPAVDRILLPVAALLLAVVGLVLLIACANLASFLLARALDRRREIAVRRALGASRHQLVRQMLIESVLLALLGGAGGVLVAHWATQLLVGFQPPLPIPINLDIAIDSRVLLFTLLISTGAGIAFGLVPGLTATRTDMSAVLREEAGSVTGARSRVTVRGALVVGQIAFSMLLLIAAGLFLRSLEKAQRIDPGFDTGPGAIIWPNIEASGFDDERGEVLQRQLGERLRTMPGVTSVTMVDRLPLGAAIQTNGVNIDGVEPPPDRDTFEIDYTNADASYFTVMDVPLVAGRNFTPADAGGDRVAIVSETAARRYWPGRQAVGQLIYIGSGKDRPVRVVGVARDTKVRSLGENARPYMYLNAEQSYIPSLMFVVRGSQPESELLAAAHRVALELDPELVILEAKTMKDHLALLLYPPRMAALLLSVFGGLALLLAAVGLYGMVSYAVARRTREVGIRSALGASRRDIVMLVTGDGMRLIITGCAIGLALAIGVTWLLSGFLYGIRATDAMTFLMVPAVLVGVGFLASWVPARRAATVEPSVALRTE